MKVRIVFSETGTGETSTIDADIARLTGDRIAMAISQSQEDLPAITVLCFIVLDGKAAFVMSSCDDYFGKTLWTGVVYTDFI